MSDDYRLTTISAQAAMVRLATGAVLVDVRKPAAVAASGVTVRGALRRDPLTLCHDDPLIAETRPLIVFCVHGHEVSRFACALLLMHGRDVAYVAGGFAALRAAGAAIDETRP